MSNTSIAELPHSKVCFQFAKFLCNQQFDDAENLLTTDLRKQNDAATLKKHFLNMVHYEPPDMEPTPFDWSTEFELGVINTLEEYPSKTDSAIGWAYCYIMADGISEAVAVTVEKHGDKLLIASIEWGRP